MSNYHPFQNYAAQVMMGAMFGRTEPTPGPWTVEVLDGYITGRILGSPARLVNGKPDLIVGQSVCGEGVQRQVDAHLIAAAPDLLAAARLFAQWSSNETMDDPPEHPTLAEVTLAIDAALTKAAG
jgi:hypothetical protein